MTDLDQVTRLRPAVDDPTPEWLAATRNAMMDHAAEPRRPRSWTQRRGNLVAAAAGIAVLALLAVITPSSSNLMTPGTQHNQYVYVKQGYTDENGGQLSISEGWYRIDSGTVEQPPRTGPPCTGPFIRVTSIAPPSSRAPAGGVSKGGPCPDLKPGAVRELTSPGSDAPSIIGWSHEQLTTLPTDPTQLRAKLYEMAKEVIAHKPKDQTWDYANTPDGEVFILVWATLLKALAPPDLVTACYQVLPTIPGIIVNHDVKDAAGRPGVGFTLAPDHQPAWETTAVFDPTGAHFLGTNAITDGHPEWPEKLVLFSSTLVDKIGDRG